VLTIATLQASVLSDPFCLYSRTYPDRLSLPDEGFMCFHFTAIACVRKMEKTNTLARSLQGVRGPEVKVVDFEPLAPHRRLFESHQELWIISWEGIHVSYNTSIVLLM
jgi:hypothetical protein